MSATLNCPACGAAVSFKSKASLFQVCPYCRSTLVRHDINLETLGTMAELQEDLSPLQIGARGRYEGKAFELIGRLRVTWADGAWNEWCAHFEGDREGWLAEAQGTFAMSFAVTPKTLPPLASLKTGQKLALAAGQSYEVTDIKKCECAGSEGELPFKAVKGRQAVSVDLTGPGGRFASLEYAGSEEPRAYVGHYAELEALQFTGLRKLDGW